MSGKYLCLGLRAYTIVRVGACIYTNSLTLAADFAGLPSFRKLWGTVNEPLMPGNYTVTVTNGVLSDGSYLNPSTEAEQTFLYPVIRI